MRCRSGSREVEGPGQLVDGGRFAAGDDESVEAVELGGPADTHAGGARGLDGLEVLTEVALKCQDADPQAGAGFSARGGARRALERELVI